MLTRIALIVRVKNTELKQARDRALYAAFKRLLAERGFPTMREAASAVCKQPAPRFFIEPEKASLLVGYILNDCAPSNWNRSTRRLAQQLYARYLAYVEAHPGSKMSRERIMEMIVEQPAPEFYIEGQRARKILYAERSKARKKWERWRER